MERRSQKYRASRIRRETCKKEKAAAREEMWKIREEVKPKEGRLLLLSDKDEKI